MTKENLKLLAIHALSAVENSTNSLQTRFLLSDYYSSSQPLNCRDLIGHHGDDEGINVVEFSNDGSLFVSGGDGGRILLWPTSKAVDKNWKPKPTAIETEHEKPIWCLAISPDNRRIFSGSRDNKLLIQDVQT